MVYTSSSSQYFNTHQNNSFNQSPTVSKQPNALLCTLPSHLTYFEQRIGHFKQGTSRPARALEDLQPFHPHPTSNNKS